MASVSSRIFEMFRNLKSDAVPKPPRKTKEDASSTPADNEETSSNYNVREEDEDDHEEIIFTEDDCEKEEKKPKFKFPFKPKKDKDESKDPKPQKNKRGSYSSVNTQATGTVFNVVNATGVQFGSNYVYHLSAMNGSAKPGKTGGAFGDDIEKDNLITLLMEAKIQPTHKYIDFIAKNLGMNWQSFFVSLGYLKGRIETLEMEKGITEARYKLLRDWTDNDDDGTLGRLATLLWEEGERQIVRELSIIYKENKK